MRSWLHLLSAVPASILVFSCSSTQPYRTCVPESSNQPTTAATTTSAVPQAGGRRRTAQEGALYAAEPSSADSSGESGRSDTSHETWKQDGAAYDLFYLELDDQGLLHPGPAAKQLSSIDRALRRYTDEGECLSLLVYVHGWKHDARTTDDDVKKFRKLMRFQGLLETDTPDPHKVVGIFVGWRGLSAKWPFTNLSFWDRKSTASKVAAGSARDLFALLHAYQQERNAVWNADKDKLRPLRAPVRMLIIGHSFGAQIVYESVSPYLIESLANEPEASTHRYADMVILVEPAFEANRFAPLFDMATRATEPKQGDNSDVGDYQAPILVSITSTADFATRQAFTWGRYPSVLFQKYASKEEWAADLNTMGFVDRYITHQLVFTANGSEPPECKNWEKLGNYPTREKLARDLIREGDLAIKFFAVPGEIFNQDGKVRPEKKWVRSFCGGSELRFSADPKIKPNIAVWNVRTYKEIVPSHTAIEGEVLESFFRQIYRDSICYPGRERKRDPGDGLKCEKEMNDHLKAKSFCAEADVIKDANGEHLSEECTKKFTAAMTVNSESPSTHRD